VTRARRSTVSTATTRPLNSTPGVISVGCKVITVTAGGAAAAAVVGLSAA
jgi:hypothetical protein